MVNVAGPDLLPSYMNMATPGTNAVASAAAVVNNLQPNSSRAFTENYDMREELGSK